MTDPALLRLVEVVLYLDGWLGGDQWGSMVDVYLDPMGGLFVGLVGLALMASLYMSSGDVILPTIVAMLLGGFVASSAPAGVQRAGMLLLVLGVALALFRLWTSGGR